MARHSRHLHAVLLGVGAWVFASELAAQPADTWRIQRMRAWITAALEHQPGQADAGVRDVRGWRPADLDDVADHVHSVIRLMRVPTTTTFVRPADRLRNIPARSLAYSRREIASLRALALDVAQRADGNQLLRRGAMLHTDIGMLAPPELDLPRNSSNPALRQRTLHLADGRTVALGDTTGHWEMAMRLLDAIAFDQRGERAAPAEDPFVRLWYRALARFMLLNGRLWLPHFDRGLRLFADDADLLMLSGSLHETLATARIQDAVNASDVRRPELDARGRTIHYDIGVRSRGDELRAAESSLRRALAADPDLVEARIRHGRVLTLLGRPRDAVGELKAGTGASSSQLRYYAWLFLGDVAESAGDAVLARQSYEAAADLYQRAQSPVLALSQMAHAAGAPSLRRLNEVLRLSADEREREDPWWTYHSSAGRDADEALKRVHDVLLDGDRR